MAERRRGLGRGLGALIPSAPQNDEGPAPVTADSAEIPAATAERPTAQAAAEVDDIASAPAAGGKNATRASSPTSVGRRTTPPRSEAPAEDPASLPVDDDSAAAATTRDAPPRGGTSRPKRPVDVFFDGAPTRARSDEDQADDNEADDQAAGSSRPGKPANRRGRRAVSAEAMGNALARGSRAGRSLGPRTATSEDATAAGTDDDDVTSGPPPTPADAPDEGPSPLSTPVDNVGESVQNPETRVSRETLVDVPGAVFAEIPVNEIEPNARQPRSVFDEDEMGELVHSIRTIGVLQPIVVRRRTTGTGYELVMGERRWRATQRAGLDTIPAIVRTTDDTDMLRDALLENLHRSQLNPLEEAAAYQQLLDDFAATHEELATRIGRSRPQISNTLRLLQLPPLVQRRVAAGVLSAGHARALLSLADAGEIEKLSQRIVAEGMSVRATEEAVALSDGLKRAPRTSSPRNSVRHERLDYLATSLSDYLDTSVKVSLGARKGKVSIEFGSVEDLNRIIDMISPDVRQ